MKLVSLKKLAITLAISTSAMLAPMQKSHAIVGLCSWNPPLMGAGILVASAGYVVGFAGAGAVEGAKEYIQSPFLKIPIYAVGGTVGVIGFLAAWIGQIALPDGSTTLEFSPLQAKDHDVLRISAREASIYNSEIDQVNFVMEQVTSELNEIEKPSVSDAAAGFAKYKDSLSPETLKVLQKISFKMVTK